MRVKVNRNTCRQPLDCRRCLLECPGKVFLTYPENRNTPDEQWIIRPAFQTSCTGCGKCIDFCSTGSISLTFP